MAEDHFEGMSVRSDTQFTVRAIIVGCTIGCLVTAMNIYVGLKIGWSFGGSIMSAILGFAIFQVIKPTTPYSKLENNITQTAGSAAGSMASAAGLLAPIPAMQMLGYDIPIWGLFMWATSTAFMGVMFAVPLRRQYVILENLKFPTGLATANTVNALYASSDEGLKKAKSLMYFGIFAFIFSLIVHDKAFPMLEHPPIGEWFPDTVIASLSLWGFSLLISPVMYGAGLMVGPRVAISLVLGAAAGWSLGYFAQQQGWAPAEHPMVIHDKLSDTWGARGWILWTGAAIMVSEAIMSLVLSGKTVIKSFQSVKSAATSTTKKSENDIPNSWWIIGLIISSIVTIIVAHIVFSIPFYMSALAIVLSFFLANVAVRATGETDINPIGGVGKVTQLVFGSMSDSISGNLMSAGITGAGASQAGDMMQDLKTGHLLGASPKSQFKAQLWGILAGMIVAVPIYLVFDAAWDIGGKDSPLGAPAALAWKAVAEVMSKGVESLPPFATKAALFGMLFGASLALIRKFAPKLSTYTPSGIAFGIAFMIPGYYSIAMFIGAVIGVVWKRKNGSHFEQYVFPVASGLLVGEGLGGIVKALFDIATT